MSGRVAPTRRLPANGTRGSVALWAIDRWPGAVQRAALAGGVAGSFLGLLFGLLSINRPVLNGLLFYVLGFVVGGLLGAAAAALFRLVAPSAAQRQGGDGAARHARPEAGAKAETPVTPGRRASATTTRNDNEE